VAFGAYFTLIKKVGVGLASYTESPRPVIAVLLSTLFEGFAWTWTAVMGVALAPTGQLSSRSSVKRERAGSFVASAGRTRTPMSHVNRLLLAKGLRAFGDGYISLLLPLYLLQLGFSPLQVGIIATTTLLGSGVMTLLVGLHAYRFHYRSLLLAATMLMAGTGFGFAFVSDFWPLLAIALVGTLNPSSGDVSVFLPLEHAVLSRVVDDSRRTAIFARYSLAGSLSAAAGALAAALPGTAAETLGVPMIAAMRAFFVLYALLAGLAASFTAACRAPSLRRPARGQHRSIKRRRPCIRLRRSSASTRSAEALSCSRCSRCGSTRALPCR
jgi:MFS family permease